MKLVLVAFVLAIGCSAPAQEAGIELKVSADFLALHASGTAPPGTTGLQYRLAHTGEVRGDATWETARVSLGADGAFVLDLPLETSRWSELQLRALKGEEVLASRSSRRKPRGFEMLKDERIAALPEPERESWEAYLQRSNESFEREWDRLAAECRQLSLPRSKAAPSGGANFDSGRYTEASSLASAEATTLVDVVISYQTPSGGWSKAVNYAAGPRQSGTHWTSQSGEGWHYCGTLDNRSTTDQIRFLAAAHLATRREDAGAAALRGIDWLLAAQFPNGGWPQNYPAEPGYHEAVTLNDNAMVHAMEVLLDVAEGKEPFSFADEPLRHRAREAFNRGIAWLARAQVKVHGIPTVWCAQHDPITLEPVAARKKEPASLSGAESAEALKFLMRRAPVSATIAAMVEPALAWLDAHRVTALRKTKNSAGRTDYVPDPTSTEIYWARFYDVETGSPIFAGADDGIIYPTFSEMAAKNKVGYDYFTTKPGELLDKEVARWRKRQ